MRGRETCHGSAELWQSDKIVATATGTFVIRKMQGEHSWRSIRN